MSDRVRGYAHRVDIEGDVPTVWRAFTEGVHLVRWCAPDAQLRPRAGGLFRASVDRVTLMEAHIDVYDANRRLRLIYLPSATSWVFSSLHTSVGMAFVGAVVGEYLGSAKGVGYLILQAEGVFDISTVIAGIVVLTVFALLLDYAVTRIEARLLVWRPRAAETERL